MAGYGGRELSNSFRTVRKNTITIAEEIPESKYSFRATPDTRSVAELLVHISILPGLQYKTHAEERRTTLAGIDFPAFLKAAHAEEKSPRTKDQILELLRSGGETFGSWLETLSDEFLAEPVAMLPGMSPASKTRMEMLLSVKEHEMHHRAQLMLIERLVGITPHLTRQMQERLAQAATAAAGRSAAS